MEGEYEYWADTLYFGAIGSFNLWFIKAWLGFKKTKM